MSHFKGIMRNKKGVTLVELIIAMAIFGMIMVSVFPAYLILNLTNIVSKENVSANYVAQQSIEELINLSNSSSVTQSNFSTEISALGFTLQLDGTYLNTSNLDFNQKLSAFHDEPEDGFTRVILIVETKHPYVFNSSTINDYRSQIETIIALEN